MGDLTQRAGPTEVIDMDNMKYWPVVTDHSRCPGDDRPLSPEDFTPPRELAVRQSGLEGNTGQDVGVKRRQAKGA